jgi:hypothetical protein
VGESGGINCIRLFVVRVKNTDCRIVLRAGSSIAALIRTKSVRRCSRRDPCGERGLSGISSFLLFFVLF